MFEQILSKINVNLAKEHSAFFRNFIINTKIKNYQNMKPNLSKPNIYRWQKL